jgi:hypothetical protein
MAKAKNIGGGRGWKVTGITEAGQKHVLVKLSNPAGEAGELAFEAKQLREFIAALLDEHNDVWEYGSDDNPISET